MLNDTNSLESNVHEADLLVHSAKLRFKSEIKVNQKQLDLKNKIIRLYNITNKQKPTIPNTVIFKPLKKNSLIKSRNMTDPKTLKPQVIGLTVF